MVDSFAPEVRSEIMRNVRSKDSALEKTVRSALWREGLRFRKNVSTMPGKPDIVFTRRKVVVFVDSCFWHGCPRHCRIPESNRDYWEKKIARNRARDKEVNRLYRSRGWKVLRVWEHAVDSSLPRVVKRVLAALYVSR